MKWPFNWPRHSQPTANEVWLAEQLDALATGQAVPPPWIAFPGAEPWSFKQGVNEAWMNQVFLPFWRGLTPEARCAYLDAWPPPHEYWLECMMSLWR